MDLQAVAGDRLEIPRAMGENAGKSSNFTAWIFQHATVDFRRLSMTLMCDMQKKHLHKLFNTIVTICYRYILHMPVYVGTFPND